MTTIAIINNKEFIEVSVDSQCTLCSAKIFDDLNKFFENDNFLIVASGKTHQIRQIQQIFYDDNIIDLDIKTFKNIIEKYNEFEEEDDKKEFEIIVINKKTKKIFMIENTNFYEISDVKFITSGSGFKFALAALHLNKNTKQAVKLASKLDIYTNDNIKTFKILK